MNRNKQQSAANKQEPTAQTQMQAFAQNAHFVWVALWRRSADMSNAVKYTIFSIHAPSPMSDGRLSIVSQCNCKTFSVVTFCNNLLGNGIFLWCNSIANSDLLSKKMKKESRKAFSLTRLDAKQSMYLHKFSIWTRSPCRMAIVSVTCRNRSNIFTVNRYRREQWGCRRSRAYSSNKWHIKYCAHSQNVLSSTEMEMTKCIST